MLRLRFSKFTPLLLLICLVGTSIQDDPSTLLTSVIKNLTGEANIKSNKEIVTELLNVTSGTVKKIMNETVKKEKVDEVRKAISEGLSKSSNVATQGAGELNRTLATLLNNVTKVASSVQSSNENTIEDEEILNPELFKNIRLNPNAILSNSGLSLEDQITILQKLNEVNNTIHEISSNSSNINDLINKLPVNSSSISGLNETVTNLLNLTRGIPNKPVSKWTLVNQDPTRWLMLAQAPWNHVSGHDTENETEVIQVCKFENYAICSAEYRKWRTKLWFHIAEAEDRNGINITAFEKGHQTRVEFINKVNGTDCQIFNNGTFHQICVKVYNYDKSAGPTGVCVQLGTAIFNQGVASADYGCFRFGSTTTHDDPMEGESPRPAILNNYILTNNYQNIIDTGSSTDSADKMTSALLFPLFLLLLKLII